MIDHMLNGLPIAVEGDRVRRSKQNRLAMMLLISLLPPLSSPAAALDGKQCAGLAAAHTRELDQIRYLYERMATKAVQQRETRRACLLYLQIDQALNIAAAEYEKCSENADQIYRASKQTGVRMDNLKCAAFNPPVSPDPRQLASRD